MEATTRPTINTYVSDMLALERHIEQPLEHQAQDSSVAKFAEAARAVSGAFSTTQAHIRALERRLEELGGHAGSPIKSGVASALGSVAAAIGDVRKTEVSKYLRDDYSALCLASAGYTMLYTTALALGDNATASLAKDHLADEATSVLRLSKTIPMVVLAELEQEGLSVDPAIANDARRDVENAWKQTGYQSSSQ